MHAEDRAHAAHHASIDLFREHKERHVRPEAGPSDTYAHPVTLAHEVGWHAASGEEPLGMTRHPKKHCAETKFMAALHSSGYI